MKVRRLFSCSSFFLSALITATTMAPQLSLAADALPSDIAKTATCVLNTTDSGVTNYAVFYLAGYGSDGSSYYRTISAPIYELSVKPDGTVESNPNPCSDPPEFQK